LELVRAVPHRCVLYPRILFTTEDKARKHLSLDSGRVPVITMETECAEQKLHNNKKSYK